MKATEETKKCAICGSSDTGVGQIELYYVGNPNNIDIWLCDKHVYGYEFCDYCGKRGTRGELIVWGNDIESPSSPVCIHEAGESTGFVCQECAAREELFVSHVCDKCGRQVVVYES